MPVQRLHHAVLYVRDVDRTAGFYEELLGFAVRHRMPGRAAFLTAPGSTSDHDLGIFAVGDRASDSEAGRSTVGLYHLAWEVDTLQELARLAERLREAGALVGASDHVVSKSLYCRDPDGLEFEVVWNVPEELLPAEHPLATRPLDLPAEIARYGGDRLTNGMAAAG